MGDSDNGHNLQTESFSDPVYGRNFLHPDLATGLHRNKQIFGEDAEIFRPERWLEKDKGDLQRFFFSFGAGSRTCIGRNISWMEMSKLIPTLFRHFDLSLVDPEKPLKEECSFFVLQTGLHMILKPRMVPEVEQIDLLSEKV